MAINVLLMIDGGATINDLTTFEVKPEIGEVITFWRNGRDLMNATVTAVRHQQSEQGYFFVVEAETSEGNQIDQWISNYRPSGR
ncbi:hypothetical protein LL251_17155 [Sphingobium naphthae]|nr:hypothetical protein [Sphingobium naphthae]